MAFTLRHPATPEEAIALVAKARADSVSVLAGGTDLLADLDQGRARPTELLSLARLPWRFLTWNGDTLTIGTGEWSTKVIAAAKSENLRSRTIVSSARRHSGIGARRCSMSASLRTVTWT